MGEHLVRKCVNALIDGTSSGGRQGASISILNLNQDCRHVCGDKDTHALCLFSSCCDEHHQLHCVLSLLTNKRRLILEGVEKLLPANFTVYGEDLQKANLSSWTWIALWHQP